MSGGVDSSVAAFLMKEKGYECIGATMKLYDNEEIGISREKTCCSLDDIEDARAVARRLFPQQLHSDLLQHNRSRARSYAEKAFQTLNICYNQYKD